MVYLYSTSKLVSNRASKVLATLFCTSNASIVMLANGVPISGSCLANASSLRWRRLRGLCDTEARRASDYYLCDARGFRVVR